MSDGPDDDADPGETSTTGVVTTLDPSTTSEEPPEEWDWCLYEVIADAAQTPLNVYAEPDPTSAVQYTLDIGDTVWGAPTVVDGYRDLNRSLGIPQWAEAARLLDTGQCENDDDDDGDEDTEAPPEEPPLPQGFQMPFECGQAWRLDTWAHAPALDMVREPDQHGTDGALLRAPAPGVVNQSYYHDQAGNMVQIDHGGGWYTTYIHMQSRSVNVGDVLARGDAIGAVGATGPTSNGHPHLHFELGFDANGDGQTSWGFAGAERVNPWFDGVEYGQANGQTWRDVVSNNCP